MSAVYRISDEFRRRVASAERAARAPARTAPVPAGPLIENLQTARMLVNRQFEPRVELIHGLVREGETILFVGRPKVGKSRLLDQLALSLVSATPFFDLEIPQKKRVLYLDIENKPHEVRNRLLSIGQDRAAVDNFVLYTPEELCQNRADLSRADGMSLVLRMFDLAKPDVLVIDTLRLFMGARWDERRSDQVLMMYNKISELRQRFPRLAVILVHHLRKTDFKTKISLRIDPAGWIEGASGHYSLIGHSEVIWGFDRELQPDGSEQIVFNGKARNLVVPLFLLEDLPDMSYRRLQGEEFAKGMMSPKEQTAWRRAKELKHFRFDELEKASKIPARIVAGMVKKAQALGILDYAQGKYFVRAEEQKQGFFWEEKE